MSPPPLRLRTRPETVEQRGLLDSQGVVSKPTWKCDAYPSHSTAAYQNRPLVMRGKEGAARAALKVVGLPQREEKLIKDEPTTIMRVAVGRIS